MRSCTTSILALAVCCLSGVSVLASAVEYPIKPIQVIVPTGSGGDTDINARIISKYLQKYIGKPVVVTNVTGAGGVIGSRQVKDSAPDGYSVLFFHYGTLTQTLMKKAYFYILDDFEVNGIPLMDNTSVIVTRTGNYKDMTELVADAKARPEQVKYGIETGTVGHLVTYIIQDLAGVKFNIIDTGVAATKNAALLSGQSDVFFATYLAVKSFVDSGDFSLLGLISEQRNPDLPDLKTLKEQGIDFSLAKFFYFAFPKGTPTDAMNIFNDALRKICADPAAKAEFAKFLINLDYIEKDEAHKIIEGTKEKFAKHIDKIM